MKKNILYVGTLLVAGSLLCSSCIGSFNLFNKYEKWQCNMTGNKFVNGIVGLILQPIVAPVCLFVDAIVLNTIEFWSGDNPMTASTTQKVLGSDGRYYVITTQKDGYQVESPDGKLTLFTHDKRTDSWSVTADGQTRQLVKYNKDGSIQATLQNGQTVVVSNDEAGLQAIRQAIWNGDCFAMR